MDGSILRFTRAERALHWATGVAVLVCAVTGFVLYVGWPPALIGRRTLLRDVHVAAGVVLPVPLVAAYAGRWRAAVRAGGNVLDAPLVRELLGQPAAPAAKARNSAATLEEIEREAIRHALHDCNGGRRCAARRLGIAESTLYEKIRRYDLGKAGRKC